MHLDTGVQQRLIEQRQKRQNRKWLMITAAILAFLLAAGAAYLWLGGGLSKKKMGGLLSSNRKINILVLGVDERANDVGRSDTLFLLTVDTDSKEVSMLSIPRDTRVKIPGNGWDKINHAYAFGKTSLSIKTVEDFLGIPIDYYVKINITNFQKIIDAVGGVDINVEKPMHYTDSYDDNGGLYINFSPGLQHLNGKTAIEYVRYRDEEGDIGRIARQQKFIKALLNQVATPGVIIKIPAIIGELSAAVETDMSAGDMLDLAQMLKDAAKQGLVAAMVPGKPVYISEISYWLPDIITLRQYVAKIEGGNLADKDLVAAQDLASEYDQSIAPEVNVVEVPKPPDVDTGEPTRMPEVNASESTDQQSGTAVTALAPPPANAAESSGSQNVPQAQKPAVPPAETAKPDGNPDKTESAKPPAPTRLTFTVVNGSGDPDAGNKIATMLRSRGYEVTSVINSASAIKSTLVVCYSSNSVVIDKLADLPFKYTLRVTSDDSQYVTGSVFLGNDYDN